MRREISVAAALRQHAIEEANRPASEGSEHRRASILASIFRWESDRGHNKRFSSNHRQRSFAPEIDDYHASDRNGASQKADEAGNFTQPDPRDERREYGDEIEKRSHPSSRAVRKRVSPCERSQRRRKDSQVQHSNCAGPRRLSNGMEQSGAKGNHQQRAGPYRIRCELKRRIPS